MSLTMTVPDDTSLAALYEAGDYPRALRLIDAEVRPALADRPADPESAGLALLVADVYRDTARYAEAEEFYLQALAGLGAGGKDRAPYARALAHLADLYVKLDRDDRALELYLSARAAHEAAADPDPAGHARCLHDLAGVLDFAGRRREAVGCLRDARRVADGAGVGPAAVADLLMAEARTLYRVEGVAAAVARSRKAVDLRRGHSGEDHPETAYARYALATLVGELDPSGEAVRLLDGARATLGAALGEGHPRYAGVLEAQARLAASRGEARAAEALARQALGVYRAALGDRHTWTADAHVTLGWVLHADRRLLAAEEEYQAGLAVYRDRFGEDHPVTAGTQLALAELREAAGRPGEAAEMTRAAAAVFDALGDDARYERAGVALTLARMAADAGEVGEAEAGAARALDLAAGAGNDPQLCVPALLLRARVAVGRGDVSAALGHLGKADAAAAALPASHYLRQEAVAMYAHLDGLRGEPWRAVGRARDAVRDAGDGPGLPWAVGFLAGLLHDTGNLVEAEGAYERALAVRERRQGKGHPDLAPVLRGLARVYLSRGNGAAAEVRFRKALEVRKDALGDRHPDTAESLADLAGLAHGAGDLRLAHALYTEVAAIRRECLGEAHPETVAGRHGLATVVWAGGDPAAAAKLLEEALAPLEDGHPEASPLRHTLALVCHDRGEAGRALELLGRVLRHDEGLLGEGHDGLTPVLIDLARVHAGLGDHLEARAVLERVRRILAGSPVPRPLDEARVLSGLSDTHRHLHDRDRAVALAEHALRVARSALPGGADVALLPYLTHAATAARTARDYRRAEGLLAEAEGVVRRAGGARHPVMAGVWAERAALEAARGRAGRAADLYERAADLAARSLGEDHPDHAATRRALGLHLAAMKQYLPAERHLRTHLGIVRRTAGPDHPAVALAHQALAEVHRRAGDLTAAEAECRAGLEVVRRAADPADAVLAGGLYGLGVVLRLRGRLAEAAAVFAEVLELDRESPAGGEGMAHLDTERELAWLEAARGDEARALERMGRVLAAHESLVGPFGCLPPGPGRDGALTAPGRLVDQVVTLALRVPGSAGAAESAVRWNALAPAELVAGDRADLRRRHPRDAAAIDRWFDLNVQIAGRELSGAGLEGLEVHRGLLARWGAEREQLDADLADRVPSVARLRAWRAATPAAVRAALPDGAALVELVEFRPVDFADLCAGRDGSGPARLAAVVLSPDGAAAVDLGPAGVAAGRGGAEVVRAAVSPHLGGRARVVVGHGGTPERAWAGLGAGVRAVRSGRELTSPLLGVPPAGWVARLRGWLGI